jgi:hypothetical protein
MGKEGKVTLCTDSIVEAPSAIPMPMPCEVAFVCTRSALQLLLCCLSPQSASSVWPPACTVPGTEGAPGQFALR